MVIVHSKHPSRDSQFLLSALAGAPDRAGSSLLHPRRFWGCWELILGAASPRGSCRGGIFTPRGVPGEETQLNPAPPNLLFQNPSGGCCGSGRCTHLHQGVSPCPEVAVGTLGTAGGFVQPGMGGTGAAALPAGISRWLLLVNKAGFAAAAPRGRLCNRGGEELAPSSVGLPAPRLQNSSLDPAWGAQGM